MEGDVFMEENRFYRIDFTNAEWAEGHLKQIYDSAKVSLSAVDFIAELQDHIVFVEYKNSSIPNASNPGAFNPASEKSLCDMAKKYFDSLHYLRTTGKSKKIRYVYIVEADILGSSERLKIRNKLQAKLPFLLQEGMPQSLIDGLRVLSIEEWNRDADYGAFPLTLCAGG